MGRWGGAGREGSGRDSQTLGSHQSDGEIQLSLVPGVPSLVRPILTLDPQGQLVGEIKALPQGF